MLESVPAAPDTGHRITDLDLTRSCSDAWAHALRLLVENEQLKERLARCRCGAAG